MRSVTLLVVLFMQASVFAAGLPAADGVYVGKGTWLINGEETQFDITSAIATASDGSQTMVDTYNSSATYEYNVSIDDKGVLKIFRKGELSGNGYCVKNSCHVNYAFADTGVTGEETFIINGNTIQRIGSRGRPGGPTTFVHTELTKLP